MRKLLFAAALIGLTPLVALAGNPVENSYGVTGSTSGTVTIRTLTGTYNFNLPATAGSSGAPLLSGGGGSTAMTWGSRSGNTTTFGTTTGTFVGGNCVSVDASGNFQDAGSACGTGSGSGTVTSVALSLPSFITVSGSPVTTTGTLTGTLATQTANTVFGGPTTGSATAPTFRALVAADIPATAVTAATYGDATHVGQFTVDAAGRLTAASSVTITGAAPTGSAGGALTGTYPNPTLATQAANTALANVSGSTAAPTAASLPSCTDTGGNHLNYTSGTGFSCGTSGGGGGPSRQTNTTAVGNGADTTEDNLQTLTLTGGTMSTGSYLRLIAAGHFTGSTDSKTAKLIVGTQTLCTVSASSLTVTQWQVEATFVATGSSTNVTAARCWSGSGSSSMTNAQLGPTPGTNLGITLSSDVTIKTSGRNSTASTANTIVSDILIMEYFP